MPTTPLQSITPLYGFTDPAGGSRDAAHARLKKVASHMAIAVGGTDGRSVFILNAESGRWSTDEYIERLYDTCERYALVSMGGESNGLAGLFIDSLERDARWRKRHLPLVSVAQPTHIQKDYRIRTILQPLVGHGRLFVASHLTKLLDQIAAFPLSPHKDLIDCAASLCRFIPPRPPAVEADSERQQLLAYLRNRGTDPATIEAIARGERTAERAGWTDAMHGATQHGDRLMHPR